MNFVFPITTLFYVYVLCSGVTWAFLDHQFLSFKNVLSPRGTDEAGEPLLLTPLLDADKVDEAVYQSEVKPAIGDIQSFAGYFTVNRTTKSHLYFWFIPRTEITHTAKTPLVLWLQGGPGCSSLFGLFSETGPFRVTDKGLEKRVDAWTNDYHMLYIDQPVGTGFSFTENQTSGYISTQTEVGEHLYEALNQFYKLFYKLRDHDFYIAGESYAGKYIPALGYKIHRANQRSPQLKIPLKGMMIGNGFMDPENMFGYAEYLCGLGLIDKSEYIQIEDRQDKTRYAIRSGDWLRASKHLNLLFKDIHEAIYFNSLYDYTRDNFGGDDSYVDFLIQDKVRRNIHAGAGEYSVCSGPVFQKFQTDFLKTVRPWIEELLEHYPILFYNGQFDIVCAHPLTENIFRNLHWSGASLYGQAKRKVLLAGDMVAGYYKSAGNLIDVLIRDASHMVPSDQPKNLLKLVNLFIKNRPQDNSTTLTLHL